LNDFPLNLYQKTTVTATLTHPDDQNVTKSKVYTLYIQRELPIVIPLTPEELANIELDKAIESYTKYYMQ
jgi:hypothetical protein